MKKRIVTVKHSLCWHEAEAILGGIDLLSDEVLKDEIFKEHYEALLKRVDEMIGYQNGEVLDMYAVLEQEEMIADDDDDDDVSE